MGAWADWLSILLWSLRNGCAEVCPAAADYVRVWPLTRNRFVSFRRGDGIQRWNSWQSRILVVNI